MRRERRRGDSLLLLLIMALLFGLLNQAIHLNKELIERRHKEMSEEIRELRAEVEAIEAKLEAARIELANLALPEPEEEKEAEEPKPQYETEPVWEAAWASLVTLGAKAVQYAKMILIRGLP